MAAMDYSELAAMDYTPEYVDQGGKQWPVIQFIKTPGGVQAPVQGQNGPAMLECHFEFTDQEWEVPDLSATFHRANVMHGLENPKEIGAWVANSLAFQWLTPPVEIWTENGRSVIRQLALVWELQKAGFNQPVMFSTSSMANISRKAAYKAWQDSTFSVIEKRIQDAMQKAGRPRAKVYLCAAWCRFTHGKVESVGGKLKKSITTIAYMPPKDIDKMAVNKEQMEFALSMLPDTWRWYLQAKQAAEAARQQNGNGHAAGNGQPAETAGVAQRTNSTTPRRSVQAQPAGATANGDDFDF